MKSYDFIIKMAYKWMVVSCTAVALAACGGGSTETVTTGSVITISGTAATGNALGGAVVTVTCASGTGSATANANGSYTVNIVNGQGPCLLTATSGGTTYTSVAPGAGVCNITPLTTMLVNYLATQAGTTPSAILSSANGRAIIGSSSAVSAAENAIGAIIQSTFGVTLSTNNFLTTVIQPLNFGTQNAADADLDNLAAAGALSATGAVTSATLAAIDASAAASPFVAPTGATGT